MLKDKIAIVSSAIRGLGFEILRQLAKRGATVVMCSRGMARAENSASWIEGKTYPEDMTNAQGISEFMGHVAERHKHIDLLINNTGYPFDRIIWNKSFQEVAEEDLEKVIDVDLTGTFRLSQAAIPSMIKNVSGATGVEGAIINIASTPATAGHMVGALYRIEKSGVIAITKHIALEYGEKNIRAYTLTLGNISAEAIFTSMTMAERKKAATENSVKRWGDPREVATITASVAREDFAFPTGNTIVIDGETVML